MSSKQYFDEVANQWDTMRSSFFSEEIREKAYNKAGVVAGNTAADIGAGTGFVTEGLALKGAKVIAVDQSQAMLDTMRQKFSSFDSIQYLLGESDKLPLEDCSVDYSFANMYIHHVENPSIAIKEMARILKPGGKLVISDLDEHGHEFLKKEHCDRWMGFKREDVRQWLLDAGLGNVSIDCAGSNCCTTSNCSGESAAISIFIAYGEKL